MKECYVFGYGSLISAPSLNRTLKRQTLSMYDLIPCMLMSYERSWSYFHPVYSLEAKKNINGVFLNVQPKSCAITNGILVKVNTQEFSFLKERERGYSAVDVTKQIMLCIPQLPHFQNNLRIYTFVADEASLVKSTMKDLYIFEAYEEIMKPACLQFGGDFWRYYLNSTVLSDLPRMEGSYTLPK